MSFQFAKLTDRTLLQVSGEEASAFLQNILTNDVDALAPGEGQYSALLSPQGKVAFDFILIRSGEGFLLDVAQDAAEALLKKLKLYRLRAKVGLEEEANLEIWALFPTPAPNPRLDHLTITDPRLDALGLRTLIPAGQGAGALRAAGGTETNFEAYAHHRRAMGVPEGAVELGFEKLFALEANLEDLHGVDFRKGCYVGQELTARMKHKTELRKRLLPFATDGKTAPGTPLLAGERNLGEVIGSAQTHAFVLTRLDRLAQAEPESLTLEGKTAALVTPPYLEGKL